MAGRENVRTTAPSGGSCWTMPAFKLCYITDRKALGPVPLLSSITSAVRAGVDAIQIREKDLCTRELMALVEAAIESTRATSTRVLVNDRLDVALALGAAGVHLGDQSPSARVVREHVVPDFLIGISCHSLTEVLGAEEARADYALLGPIFETPSKRAYGPPLGLATLEEVTKRATIPILALGGITAERVKSCLEAGASGIAGISIFQNAPSMEERVRQLRAQWPR